MSDNMTQKEITKSDFAKLAEQIYDLDKKVYEATGSKLGRLFSDDRTTSVEEIMETMTEGNKSHALRSMVALIGNMARTIKQRDHQAWKEIMKEYDSILKEISTMSPGFGQVEILDYEAAKLCDVSNAVDAGVKHHRIICINRTYGSAGTEIGFALADKLKCNFYDAEIFQEVISNLEEGRNVNEIQNSKDKGYKYDRKKHSVFYEKNSDQLRYLLKNLNRYHGLPLKDAVFFKISEILCDISKSEDFVVMGRCADAILTNNHIPHVSIYITAPEDERIKRMMEINGTDYKTARKHLRKVDKFRNRYYKYYTSKDWDEANNYDFCLNSSRYGIAGSVDLIVDMLTRTENC